MLDNERQKSTVTLGPWSCERSVVNGIVQAHFIVTARDKRFPVCRVQAETHSDIDPAEANAHLIARAPELQKDNADLRALLEECRVHFEAILINTHNEVAVANGCREALAKLTAKLKEGE